MYTIIYHPFVTKDIKSFPDSLRKRLRGAIEQKLTVAPEIYGAPLRSSLAGSRKLKVGNYRIIYKIHTTNVMIITIGHRRNVYIKTQNRFSKK